MQRSRRDRKSQIRSIINGSKQIKAKSRNKNIDRGRKSSKRRSLRCTSNIKRSILLMFGLKAREISSMPIRIPIFFTRLRIKNWRNPTKMRMILEGNIRMK